MFKPVGRICLALTKNMHHSLFAIITTPTSVIFLTSINVKCLLERQCPIKRPTTFLIPFFLSLKSSLFLILGQPWLSSLACRWSLLLSQVKYCLSLNRLKTVFLIRLLDIPIAGYGPTKGIEEPFLASSSATSFLWTPEWPGTQ